MVRVEAISRITPAVQLVQFSREDSHGKLAEDLLRLNV
jgi:hypothetical protein